MSCACAAATAATVIQSGARRARRYVGSGECIEKWQCPLGDSERCGCGWCENRSTSVWHAVLPGIVTHVACVDHAEARGAPVWAVSAHRTLFCFDQRGTEVPDVIPFLVPVLELRASAACAAVFVATGARVDAFADAAPHPPLLRLEPTLSTVTSIALGSGPAQQHAQQWAPDAAAGAPPAREVLYIGGKNGELGAVDASEALGWKELVLTRWKGQSEMDRVLAVMLPWLAFVVSA